MLILSRRKNESIIIDDHIRLTVVDVCGETVKIGIAAPLSVQIFRSEVYDAVKKANIDSVMEGKNLPPAEVARLLYWQLGVKSVEVSLENGKLLTDAEEKLKKLIHAFDFETTPYLARPNPKHLPKYSDYEHLARVKEWSVREDEDGEA